MKDLRGKVALVTGAGSGIGRATAIALSERGAKLILCDIREEALSQTKALVEKHSECLLAEIVDVSNRRAMQEFASRVHVLVPAIDVLVNNAGVGLSGGLLDTPLEDWDWVIDVNLKGVIHGCHFFVPAMVRRAQGGHVVNVSSVFGVWGPPGVLGYVTTKFGVFGLSESLRSELKPHSIGVSTICPGMIGTDIVRNARFNNSRGADEVRGKTQQLYDKRGASPEKVAHAIVRAIRSNSAVLPVAPEAWALYYLKRLAPSLGGPLGRWLESRSL